MTTMLREKISIIEPAGCSVVKNEPKNVPIIRQNTAAVAAECRIICSALGNISVDQVRSSMSEMDVFGSPEAIKALKEIMEERDWLLCPPVVQRRHAKRLSGPAAH